MSATDSLALVLRTHDRSRIADVELPRDMTVSHVLEACAERWKLPAERDYTLHSERLRRQLVPHETLWQAGVPEADELVIYPLLEAGGGRDGAGTDPRTVRLANEEREVRALALASRGMLEILAAEGSPPRRYRLRLHVAGVDAGATMTGAVRLRWVHDLAIDLPSEYPLAPPRVQVETPISNLHVWPRGEVCLGAGRGLDEGLADLIARLARVIQYDPDFLDLHSVANPQARHAFDQLFAAGRLPLGTVDLRAMSGARTALKWAERAP